MRSAAFHRDLSIRDRETMVPDRPPGSNRWRCLDLCVWLCCVGGLGSSWWCGLGLCVTRSLTRSPTSTVCQFERGWPATRAAAVQLDVVVSLTFRRQPRRPLLPSRPTRSFLCAGSTSTRQDRRRRPCRGRGRSGTGWRVRGRLPLICRSRRPLLRLRHRVHWQDFTALLNHHLHQDLCVSLTAAAAALVASSSHGSRSAHITQHFLLSNASFSTAFTISPPSLLLLLPHGTKWIAPFYFVGKFAKLRLF